ncbi:MAG: hypothetical protein K0R82_2206 [Flavipsychrobacter sp.]|nr:hypothetical protein [Flavipsychrobacter sp.]
MYLFQTLQDQFHVSFFPTVAFLKQENEIANNLLKKKISHPLFV